MRILGIKNPVTPIAAASPKNEAKKPMIIRYKARMKVTQVV
jgi:hypothetical protein